MLSAATSWLSGLAVTSPLRVEEGGGATCVSVEGDELTGGRASAVVVGAFFLHPVENAIATAARRTRVVRVGTFLAIRYSLVAGAERGNAVTARKSSVAKTLPKPQAESARTDHGIHAGWEWFPPRVSCRLF